MSRTLTLSFRDRGSKSRVRIEPGGLARLGAFVAATTGAHAVALVTDRRVDALHGGAARRALQRAGLATHVIVLPAGERTKRTRVLESLWERFAGFGLTRADAVVALGGGVIGDLAGFAAATWLRGVPWIGVPTTVIAQADSSVGGKTAIDLAAGKNLAGAFHQPAGVLVDVRTLETLPARQRRAGLAEIIKLGFAVDAPLFAWCERHADALADGEPAALAGAIERAIRIKARVVSADEREREGGGRTALNFGHTLGHAIESALGFRGLLHGEAVAIGMRAAAEISERVAGLAPESRIRLEAMLDHVGLPIRMPPLTFAALRGAMASDKKRTRAAVRWVLTPRIGDASVPRAVSEPLVRAALRHAGARG